MRKKKKQTKYQAWHAQFSNKQTANSSRETKEEKITRSKTHTHTHNCNGYT